MDTTSAATFASGIDRAAATRATCRPALSGEISGSRPLADVVSMSPGTGLAPAFATSPAIRSLSALDVGPAFDPAELPALYGAATVLVGSSGCSGSCIVVADGRPWKYLSCVTLCPSRAEPITTPSRCTRLPPAWLGNSAPPAATKPSGKARPVRMVNNATSTIAARR